ncbi:hypothetical protein LUZ60_001534 [Juncus effusus]|nr:hypothetical protein LUZ60_001534 [Juncus effusus]
MKIRWRVLAISLAIVVGIQSYSCSALISSETVTPPSPKAFSDLKEAIVKGLGLHTSSDLKISGFDARDARVGQAVAYEFDIQIGKKSIPIKLLEDVSQWTFADLPLVETDGGDGLEEGNSLAEMSEKKRKKIRVLPELPPFQLAGPMELWIQDGDDMRLALPNDVEAGALKKVVLSDGAVVTVTGARSVSLRNPLSLPLPFNRSVMDPARHASGLLSLAQSLRQQAASSSSNSQTPLLSLRIVGPTSLKNNNEDRLKLKRLAPGLVQLSLFDRSGLDLDESGPATSSTLWPLTSVNGSNVNLRGFEELLASVLGKEGEKKGSFKLVKAQVSAQTYLKMSFEVEKRYIEADFKGAEFPEWKSRPEKGKAYFEVLVRVEEGGKVVPERIAQVQRPFEVQDTVVESMVSGNVSVSKVETVHPVPVYFTL